VNTAKLLFPAIRWNRAAGSYDEFRPSIERGLELGVGGFIIFGGPASAVAELTAELRERSPHPLLVGADLERGAGQQFGGATSLPPPAALAELGDLATVARAGEVTAREALAMGVNWVYAPVADLDAEPENPIVGSRAFGADPDDVSRHVVAWIEGCRQAGALSCAKHFPGHGRTTADSHLELPTVTADLAILEDDLEPFRAAIEAGVDSIMSAHVAYPALDPAGAPATLSRPILSGLLRDRLGFRGIVVTDALIMEGVLEWGRDEGETAVRAVAAGCDALLYPRDLDAVASALERAVGTEVDRGRVAGALDRIELAAGRAAAQPVGAGAAGARWGRAEDQEWALSLARRCMRPLRGRPRGAPAVDLLTLDDDVGGPFPPGPRDAFPAGLRQRGVDVREVDTATGERPLIVALYADIKGFKGRPGLSRSARERLEQTAAETVVLFGHPRLADSVPAADLLGAWGGEPLMQAAAATWLAETEPR
jgi:beta-glucosidase-like glycosyl hydrolase